MAKVEGAKAASLISRIAVLCLSVAAAVVMGSASQQLVSGRVVSFSDYGAFVYFVAATVISALFAAPALYLSAFGTASSLVSLLDILTQGFLFSATGAAFAVRGVAAVASDGSADAFFGKVSTAAAISACAAAAVSVAALTKDSRGNLSMTCGAGGGSGGSDCRHGCHA